MVRGGDNVDREREIIARVSQHTQINDETFQEAFKTMETLTAWLAENVAPGWSGAFGVWAHSDFASGDLLFVGKLPEVEE